MKTRLLLALAASAGVEISAIERRLAPLAAAGQIVLEDHHGVRMARVASP